MAIIALTLSLSQVLRGDRGPCPSCPTDADHVLVRNGTYTRHVQDGRGVSVLTIQRYRCHTCAITYSALPYDCRPYTANTWALVLAVGWIWPQAYHWTWARCHQWLADHHIDAHQRTLERWAARWRAGAAIVIARAIQWIAALYGTRAMPVWPDPDQSLWRHWRQLWQGVVQIAGDPAGSRGGLLAGSVLWGWLPITFFAGLARGSRCRTLAVEVKSVDEHTDSDTT